MKISQIQFPAYTGVRCLMMPYIQGESESVPEEYRRPYRDILNSVFCQCGDIGFLTIDESPVKTGTPHRGSRAKYDRALHTEAGRHPNKVYAWGGGGWGSSHRVTLDASVVVLIANNLDGTCVVWDAEHADTTIDGDIGHLAEQYPYSRATFMMAGEVHKISILTPHESLPVTQDVNRQFLRIVSSGVHGREPYFTKNPLVKWK
jgi:hypothetical protein